MEGLVSMKRILIIEDTDTIREELTKLLTRYGYEVLAPTDFENILEYVKENNSDLILLDINLPYFDGYIFVEK
ncbi:response regulator [Clostridium perfringens SM101]|uniref:Stage 0 sporulation protein A homolog n=1 Tax=Clostridium perfringens (strain SM101 / Type A) TaxID=289380 RepID=Q0SUQ3_CLOPS|nr:response regulator [Clostridium perfringens SM101]